MKSDNTSQIPGETGEEQSDQSGTTPTTPGPKQNWTPAELRVVLEVVAEDKGWEYAERYAERILALAAPYL